MKSKNLIEALRIARDNAHQNSKDHGFWAEIPNTSRLLAALALMHSEISEVAEVIRKDPRAMSTKCPEITAEAEECADILLRLLDYCGARGIDLGTAAAAKHEYNKGRPHMHGKRA